MFSITLSPGPADGATKAEASRPDRVGQLVSPGELIGSSRHWIRGHGTFLDDPSADSRQQRPGHQADGDGDGDGDDDGGGDGDGMDVDSDGEPWQSDGAIRSAIAGNVQRINKLITVRGLRGRYRPEVGDLIVGRITEVQSKRWKVDTGSRVQANLHLGAVSLPGGVQRRKLESDELQMRSFFQENDLLVAEVQACYADGSMSLHTRSLKYGKLRNGVLVKVPPQLILRLKSHFHTLSFGLNLIIGVNGWIWIYQTHSFKNLNQDVMKDDGFDITTEDMYSDVNQFISPSIRNKIALVSHIIQLLSSHSILISDLNILKVYEICMKMFHPTPFQKGLNQDDDDFDLDQFGKLEFRQSVLNSFYGFS